MYLFPLHAAPRDVSPVWYLHGPPFSWLVHQDSYGLLHPQYALSVPWLPQKQHTDGAVPLPASWTRFPTKIRDASRRIYRLLFSP